MMQKFLIEQSSPLKPSIATAAFSLQCNGFTGNLLVCDISANSSVSVCRIDDDRITTLYSHPLTQVCGDLNEVLRSFRQHYNREKLNQWLQTYSAYPSQLDKKNLMLLDDDRVLTCGDVDRLFPPFRTEVETAIQPIQGIAIDRAFLIGGYASFFLVRQSIRDTLPSLSLNSGDLYFADSSTIGIQIEALTTTLEKSVKRIELLNDGAWVDGSVELLECGQIGSFGKDLTMKFWRNES